MFLSLGISFVCVDMIFKDLFDRTRPFVASPELMDFLKTTFVSIPNSPSFPSGHAVSSFSTAFALYLNNKNYGRPALVYAGLVAFSRVFLCVHYLSDILVGAVIGMIVSYIVHNLILHFEKLYLKRKNILKIFNMLK